MKILAFDAATAVGSVAAVEADEVKYQAAFDCPRGRGGELFLRLDEAVNRAGKPDRIVVGIGPGSYNGIRVAIAAAVGLRFAIGAELVGVCSIRALGVDAPTFVAVADARGGTYFYAKVKDRRLVAGPELLAFEALRARLDDDAGLPVYAPAPLPAALRASVAYPDAVVLARLGAEEAASGEIPEPIYLKPAHITKPRGTARGSA